MLDCDLQENMQGGSGVVITIGRKYGSGGKEIGQRLAQRLGIPCHDADLELTTCSPAPRG